MKVVTNRLLMIHKTTRYVLNWSPKNSESCLKVVNVVTILGVSVSDDLTRSSLPVCRASL